MSGALALTETAPASSMVFCHSAIKTPPARAAFSGNLQPRRCGRVMAIARISPPVLVPSADALRAPATLMLSAERVIRPSLSAQPPALDQPPALIRRRTRRQVAVGNNCPTLTAYPWGPALRR